MNEKIPSVKTVAHLRGLGKPLLFAVDSESKPGSLIIHFVRCETIEFRNDSTFDQTQFSVVHPDNDPRLAILAGCLNPKD